MRSKNNIGRVGYCWLTHKGICIFDPSETITAEFFHHIDEDAAEGQIIPVTYSDKLIRVVCPLCGSEYKQRVDDAAEATRMIPVFNETAQKARYRLTEVTHV
jgi:hypothetical protein